MEQDTKASRTVQQINDDYSGYCTQLGDLHIKRKSVELDITAVEARIELLGKEMKQVLDKQIKDEQIARLDAARAALKSDTEKALDTRETASVVSLKDHPKNA